MDKDSWHPMDLEDLDLPNEERTWVFDREEEDWIDEETGEKLTDYVEKHADSS